MTPANFADVWREIDEAIGIGFTFKPLQDQERSLISYDPDIYFNPKFSSFIAKTAMPLQALTSERVKRLDTSKVLLDIYRQRGLIAPEDYDYSDKKFRYETELHDYVFKDQEAIYYTEGITFYKANTHYKVTGSKRRKSMKAQAAVLMHLNPAFEEHVFFDVIEQSNLYQCIPPLPTHEIEDIVSEMYEKKLSGNLNPKSKTRKLIYKTNCALLKEEKLQLQGACAGLSRNAKTIKILIDYFQTLRAFGKRIRQKDFIEGLTISRRAIIDNWKKIKEDVEKYNLTIAS